MTELTFSAQDFLILLFEIEAAMVQRLMIILCIDFSPHSIHFRAALLPFFLLLFQAVEYDWQRSCSILLQHINNIKAMIAINAFNAS